MLEASPTKLDFINGVVIDPWAMESDAPQAMAGGSYYHGVVASNLSRALGAAADARGCTTTSSDVAVRVNENGDYCFPDLAAVCGEPSLSGQILLNPTLVVEVLSPGTEAIDRGPKFERYQALSSVEEIVFVAQRRPRVERYRRHGTVWLYEAVDGLGAEIEVLGGVMRLAEVYRNVKFPPPDPLDVA